MLSANLLTTLKTLALTDRPLISATPDKGGASGPKNINLEVGQKVQGSVEAQITQNLFRVRVADQMMQMQLPAFVKPGDTIQLQVVSLLPRLTFTLSASSNPISTPESLSAASRMLSSLSQQPLERSYVRPIQSSPLWTGEKTSPDTAQLAGKLHDALSHSGLFYESHQAQWIAGTRPTTQLLLEPQNQLSQNALSKGMESTLTQTLTAQATGGQRASISGIPDHLQTLVQQQLNALETRQVLWQGQVWQGQEMRWKVRDESPRRGIQGQDEGQWSTRIDLDLPNLGGVSARLSFNGNALKLSLEAYDAKTCDRMGNASSQLVAALAERGIPVTHTQITQNEHAG